MKAFPIIFLSLSEPIEPAPGLEPQKFVSASTQTSLPDLADAQVQTTGDDLDIFRDHSTARNFLTAPLSDFLL